MEKVSELNKAGYRPKFVSEYSMGQYDFERYNEWLKFIEKWSGEINAKDVPSLEECQHYFAGINILYKQWRPIIAVAGIKEELDNAVIVARRKKRIWERAHRTNMPLNDVLKLELVDALDEIHTRLMEIKQVIGLGIVVKRNMSMAEKIKRGIHGDRNFTNLPEA